MDDVTESTEVEQPNMESTEVEQLEIEQEGQEVEETEEIEGGIEFGDMLNNTFDNMLDNMLDEAVEGIDDEEEDEKPKETVVTQEVEVEQPKKESTTTEKEEKALPPELEEIRRNMQADYTRKGQEVADLRASLEPYAIINAQLEKNPELMQQVVSLISGKESEPASNNVVEFDDPFEQLQHEAAQNAKTEVKKVIAPLLQQVQQIQQKAVITETLNEVHADPLFKPTHKAMDDYVKGEYADLHGVKAAQALYRELDTNPDVFKRMFNSFKTKVAKSAVVKPALNKQRVKAPNIATDKGAPVVPRKRVTRKTQSSLAKRAISSGSRTAAVDYFETTGMFDKIK